MPDTFSQLYVHVVFAVKGRNNLISSSWRDILYKYITGIVTNKKQKLMAINGMPDHIHILIGFKPNCVISDLIRDIKSSSSKWINENNYVIGKFEWQIGFGVFSVSHSQVNVVVNYILNQEKHHAKKSFREEYIEFLTAYNIDFKTEYLPEDFGFAPRDDSKKG
ncbi:MAG: IS200/IS605 family transposase, partial [Bacteroidota bacterium]